MSVCALLLGYNECHWVKFTIVKISLILTDNREKRELSEHSKKYNLSNLQNNTHQLSSDICIEFVNLNKKA